MRKPLSIPVNGGYGPDTLVGSDAPEVFQGGYGNDVIHAFGGNDELYGGDHNDLLFAGDGHDILVGGAGADGLFGGDGGDVYKDVDAQDTVVEFADGGYDTVETKQHTYALTDNVEALDYTGESLGDVAVSFHGIGNDLGNMIRGGTGRDWLEGGGGIDWLYGEQGRDSLFGGLGGDWLYGGLSADLLYGGDGVDHLNGDDGDDSLYGGQGDDDLYGGDDNDYLNGGDGADHLNGGKGNDVYVVEAGDTVVENAGGGVDRVETALSTYTLGAHVEELKYAGAGSFVGHGHDGWNSITGGEKDDVLYGYGDDDLLFGKGGKDTLVGGLGADTMTGGTGDDIYEVDNAGDTLIEKADEGIDTARVTASSYTLGTGVEIMEFVGAGDFTGTGNGSDNNIRGGEGKDTLSALDGCDYLYGFGGDDTLVGGDGGDTLVGGEGGDILNGGTGKDMLTGGAGLDLFVFASAGDTPIGSSERDVVTDFVNGDRLDVSGIDANANLANDQVFAFIGNAQFSAAGQLRQWVDANRTFVEGDVDGDGNADFRVELQGTYQLNAADFVL